ncbi:MAG TPA: rhomboid family intramembrane serine protease [bacterium]|nr:rhomboid family intramembrane serine protease [bacterium]
MNRKGGDSGGPWDDDDWDEGDPFDADPEDLLEDLQEAIVRPSESFLAARPAKKSFLASSLFALAAAVSSVVAWNSNSFKAAWIGNPEKIFSGDEWWRLLTSILLHRDIKHLLSNLLFLVPFGGLLTNYFGWAAFPITGLALGIATQYLSLKTYPQSATLLGASGLLYVLFGMWLALYFRAETRLRWTNRLLRVTGFALIMFIPSEFQPDVSYRTHAIGLALGMASGIFWPLKKTGFEAKGKHG